MYKTDLSAVDWQELRALLIADRFHNGRTAEQLEESFRNSFATVIAYAGPQPIGTARALSDGVCNAYIVDVWTYSAYRRQGVATAMMALLEAKLSGQHVALFTEDAVPLYTTLAYTEETVGMSKVIGTWLRRHDSL
nr:GNAT family N-acetyltransferase [Armatimonas rosea]